MIYEVLLSKDVNSFYVSRYINFINNCYTKNTTTNADSLYIEKHHILPKSVFPEFINLREHTWNCALLTPRQHFISHIMLSKIFVDPDNHRRMLCALLFMNKRNKLSSRQFAKLREDLSSLMKTNNPMFDYDIKTKAITNLMKSWTPERRRSTALKRCGVCNLTPEGKQKLSVLWTGVKKPPRQKEHINKIIENTARYIFHTPFGDFYSPNQAAHDTNNIDNLSRYLIDKKCRNNLEGYSVTELVKSYPEKRGIYKKTEEHTTKVSIARSLGVFHTPFGDFYSSVKASSSENNINNYCAVTIKKYCIKGLNGFSFTPKKVI